jgi:hypothetical protein
VTRIAVFASIDGSSTTCPSMGFSSPLASSNASSDLHWVCLSQLCSAFRFSRPLDALLRSRHLGLVSCRIRPWGSCSQRFPPPGSRHGFFFTAPPPVRHRPAPACAYRFAHMERLGETFDRDPTRPGIRTSRRSVHVEQGFTHRATAVPLSAFGAPSRISPPEPRPRFHVLDSHGLSRRAGLLHHDDRSPKCQRTRRLVVTLSSDSSLPGVHALSRRRPYGC